MNLGVSTFVLKSKKMSLVPQDIQLELGNLQETIHSTMTAFSRKQEINETYAQGATTQIVQYKENLARHSQWS